MTEETHSHDDHEPMFYCGAQSNADGDLLPSSFTVFSPNSDQHQAMHTIVEKIAESLSELDIPEAVGVLAFVPICTWEQWAELDMSAEVKMAALVEAVTADTIRGLKVAVETTTEFLQGVWIPGD